MINEILNIVAPIAKELIGDYLTSAISIDENLNPVKKENPYSDMVVNTFRHYGTARQLEQNSGYDEKKPISIEYKGDINPSPISKEETLYDIAMKKTYKYNFK